MNPKKFLENHIRGWLPKKPALPSHQRIQVARVRNQEGASIRRMKWLAIALYVVLLLFTWLDYFTKITGYATLEGALLYMKWLAISLYVVLLLFTWLDYFTKITGYATLEGALLYTMIAPLLTFVGFRIYKIESLKFWQLRWTICGALIFGFIIYGAVNFLLYCVLSLPAWIEMNGLLRLFLTMPVSYVIGTYLGHRLGKRRGFRPLYV